MTTVSPAFRCTICGFGIRSRFAPSMAPKCPSCGGKTEPTQEAGKKKVEVFCATCHFGHKAYEGQRCPRCGAIWSGFPGHRPEEDHVTPESSQPIKKQGISGGTNPNPYVSGK